MHVKQAESEVGKEIELRGWVHRRRGSGGIIFAVIRDVTGIMQVAVKKDSVDAKSWQEAEQSTVESSIIVKGVVKEDKRAPTGYEMQAKSFENVQIAEPFPITEYQSTELLLDKRHLWLRSRKMTEILRMRSYIFRYARQFLDERDFYEVSTPLLTRVGGETGSDMFEVKYFDNKIYLTESSQFYNEALDFVLERVYSFVPSFRAEKSRTVKHLAEYWHLEPDMLYFNNEQVMKLEEELVSHIATKAVEHEDILKELGVDRTSLLKIKPPFKRISYEKSLEILEEKGIKLKWGDDFGVKEEGALTEGEEKPIFIHSWPKEVKPFYMPINPKDPRTVMNSDMLAPNGHGEIIGSGERIWKLEELLERIEETEKAKNIKINKNNYAWWIDLRRYGSAPHSGFGMGMERVIKWLLNLDHIRDAIPFPRMVNRMEP